MVNYLAVLVASVISFIIPTIWYMPSLFGNKWIKLSKSKMKPSAMTMVIGFLMTFIMTFVIAVVVSYVGAVKFFDGALVGAILWLGLIAAPMFAIVNYEKKTLSLYFINTLHYLISMVISGGIFAVWR